MNTATIEIDLGMAGEIECDVDFYYTPEEDANFDCPGCDESFDIQKITANLAGGIKLDITALNIDEETLINLIKESR